MVLSRFILASASPARRHLLEGIGLFPIVQASNFDEASIQIKDPSELVQSLAYNKAAFVAAQMTIGASPTLVMGCDSVLVLQGEVHGKPQGPEDAIRRWQQMRGQVGELLTGHALLDLNRGQHLLRCQRTWVHFANVSDAEIAAYVATGEPLPCAGCFTLEGKGGAFIKKIEGCYSNVIGLSLPLLRDMLAELGYQLTDFWET